MAVFQKLIVRAIAKDSSEKAVLPEKGQRERASRFNNGDSMTNDVLLQTMVAVPTVGAEGFPGSGGIQFDGDGCSSEEQRLEIIKHKILEKLIVRLDGPLHGSCSEPSKTRHEVPNCD